VYLRCPSDGLGALDFGSGEDIVKWCLVSCRVGQKSPIVVQCAQEKAELTGGCGILALHEVGHSLVQGLGAHGGHLKSEEGDLG
jgi:hypothetical protein